jgi:hypothetical protein
MVMFESVLVELESLFEKAVLVFANKPESNGHSAKVISIQQPFCMFNREKAHI